MQSAHVLEDTECHSTWNHAVGKAGDRYHRTHADGRSQYLNVAITYHVIYVLEQESTIQSDHYAVTVKNGASCTEPIDLDHGAYTEIVAAGLSGHSAKIVQGSIIGLGDGQPLAGRPNVDSGKNILFTGIVEGGHANNGSCSRVQSSRGQEGELIAHNSVLCAGAHRNQDLGT